MKVTRIGNYVRVDMVETSRIGAFAPCSRVTYYVSAEVYDGTFKGTEFGKVSGLVRMQMSNFVVADGRLLKNRFLVEDLIEAYALQEACHG